MPKMLDIGQYLLKLFENIAGVQFFLNHSVEQVSQDWHGVNGGSLKTLSWSRYSIFTVLVLSDLRVTSWSQQSVSGLAITVLVLCLKTEIVQESGNWRDASATAQCHLRSVYVQQISSHKQRSIFNNCLEHLSHLVLEYRIFRYYSS